MNSRQECHERWSRLIELQEKSGQSVRVLCHERSLTEASFYNWRQRLRKDGRVSFALVDTNPTTVHTALELILVRGERLRIPADAAALRIVLSVLRGRS